MEKIPSFVEAVLTSETVGPIFMALLQSPSAECHNSGSLQNF
jgi:hypothetical protein